MDDPPTCPNLSPEWPRHRMEHTGPIPCSCGVAGGHHDVWACAHCRAVIYEPPHHGQAVWEAGYL